MRRLVATLGLVAAAVFHAAGAAEACSCVASVCSDATGYDAVFEATVESIEAPARRPEGRWSAEYPTLTVRLADLRALRGVAAPVVITSPDDASCGFGFRVGRRYLIFAHRSPDGVLGVSLCSLTRLRDGNSGLARYVESLAAPSRGGRIWGRVSTPTEPSYDPAAMAGVAGVRVRVEGSRTAEARTGASGEFEFIDLPPGRYTVSLDMPADRPELATVPPREVVFDNAYACEAIDIVPERSNAVTGTLLDLEGRPLSDVFLLLLPVTARTRPFDAAGYGYSTDAEGRYQFKNLPPGRYFVGVASTTGPSGQAPYRPKYARTAAGEVDFDMPVAGRVVLQPMRLERLSRVRLNGRVTFESGQPYPGVTVIVSVLDEDGRALPGFPVKTNAEGAFALNAWYAGAAYRLFVGSQRTPEVSLDVVASDDPVTIVVPRR